MSYPQYAAKFMRAADGGPPLIRSYREADSQSFSKGDFVYLSSGYLTIAADDASRLLGMALEDATSVTTGHKYIDVMVFRPGDEWAIRTYSGTTATKFTHANLGIKYANEFVSAGVSGVDSGATTGGAWTCVRLLYDEDESTVASDYYCVFMINPDVAQYGQGA